MYLPRSSSAIDLQQQPHLHRTVRHPHNPRHARPLCVPPCPHSAVQTPNQILLASPKCRSNAGCSTPQLSAGTVKRLLIYCKKLGKLKSLEYCHVAGIVTGLTNSPLMSLSSGHITLSSAKYEHRSNFVPPPPSPSRRQGLNIGTSAAFMQVTSSVVPPRRQSYARRDWHLPDSDANGCVPARDSSLTLRTDSTPPATASVPPRP
uniref:Uncharacterized protein n=1 Tax=Oryza sativa subsp. japonica TaxID=39947 RepID=Q2QU60_ORYSJ|nr:hypothetical protein LOC_Os12g17370 [Oryza sativa Japonica Group]